MNTVLAFVVLASGLPLGPAGIPQTEPFQLTEEYRSDYAAAEKCSGHPADVDAVKLGEKAVYVIDGKSVEVFLDEYARRFAIDYCWQ